MTLRKRRFIAFIINFFLFAVLLLIRSTGILTFKIYGAAPLLPLALLIALSIFAGETPAFLTGLAVGAMLDSVSASKFGFNAVTLMLIGLLAALVSNHIFNKNVRAAAVLCLLCSMFYFIVRWIVCDAYLLGFYENAGYFLHYVLPSGIYTAVFILPFYFLEKKLFGKLKV